MMCAKVLYSTFKFEALSEATLILSLTAHDQEHMPAEGVMTASTFTFATDSRGDKRECLTMSDSSFSMNSSAL